MRVLTARPTPGIGEIDDRVDAFLVHPSSRDRDTDVGLVLMVGGNDLDAEAAGLLGEVFRGQLSADEGPFANLVGERTGEVAQDADLDLVARNLRKAGSGETD